MNSTRYSSVSKVFGSESLKIYLQLLLILGFLEFIVGRIFLHVPQLSDILIPFTQIVLNFEALIEFPVLISFLYFFWKNRSSYATSVLFGLSSVLLFLITLLHFFSLLDLNAEILWLYFTLFALATILAASTKRIFAEIKERKLSNLILIAFLVLVNATYLCAYIYLSSFNISSYWGIYIPEPIVFFSFAQYLLLFDSLILFFYAMLVRPQSLTSNRKLLFKVILIPSIVVALILSALVAMPSGSRFDMAEIIALMLSMWGFAVAKSQISIYIVMFWFFLVAALLLREKGQATKKSIHTQEFIAVFLMFFAGFLNTSPYILMGVIAVTLLSSEMT